MLANLLLGFSFFMGSSVPQGGIEQDTPSGISVEINGEYKTDYGIMVSDYRNNEYEIKLFGLGAGKELLLFNYFSVFPELFVIRGIRSRGNVSESGFFPLFSIKFLVLFPGNNPRFQIGLQIKEMFNEDIGTDFIDIGVGFRL